MTLIACTPGTTLVDFQFRPFDATYGPGGDGSGGTLYHWRSSVEYPQMTWVTGGLTANYNGNWCIENRGNANAAGNPVDLAKCANEDAQRWQWNGDGELRQSSLDHKCLATSGNDLVLGDCLASPGERFTAEIFQGDNETGGLVQIVHAPTGLCIDVP
ncbi:ricin-type beta-trefoil lectin domain protein [Arthrobacter sp. H14]|uniref:ricin-type beta-trefoil lectin domain protein n=1 Tax=Arthrobacter sp. H14 TaxID=1312959 RepID=UPI00047BA419|nr:ricin-type beta-trefoil lectin domain protein [Arthrobacter sp. H14]